MAQLAFIQKEIELRQNLAGEYFTVPPLTGSKIFVLGEIDSADDFESDNLYLFLETRLPSGWQWNKEDYDDPRITESDDSDLINRTRSSTQSSRAIAKGRTRKSVCHFSFPIAYNLLANDQGFNKHWPRICFQVNSIDDWSRHRIEGYGSIIIPNTPGYHVLKVPTWRPIEDLYSEMHSFYLGGSVRIENPWEIWDTYTYDEEGKKTVVNRYGLDTQSAGNVVIKISVAVQRHDWMERERAEAERINLKQKSGGDIYRNVN